MTGLTHRDLLFSSEPLQRELARRLYAGIQHLPIVSPHGHTDPRWYTLNELFPDPAQLLIELAGVLAELDRVLVLLAVDAVLAEQRPALGIECDRRGRWPFAGTARATIAINGRTSLVCGAPLIRRG